MKPAYIALLAIFLSLVACSSMDASVDAAVLNGWIEQNKPLAGTSKLSWSDYYRELYRVAAQSEGIPGSPVIMESANAMYKSSLAYEAGKLEGEAFDSMRIIADQRIAEAKSSKGSASGGAASGAGWGKGGATRAPAPY